ncbi:hypothetical protein XENORESO_009332 [Xenotaenia resolanae]|uniref:Uncharacterized protein n=1 Tax=Xenotaenia resolanae TaxID=208358 RepID=A0ABV0VYP8_9TELE
MFSYKTVLPNGSCCFASVLLFVTPYPLVGLQSLPLHEPELLPLLTEALPWGSRLLSAAGVRLERRNQLFTFTCYYTTKDNKWANKQSYYTCNDSNPHKCRTLIHGHQHAPAA